MHHKLVLKLDDLDLDSIMLAMSQRNQFPIPDGGGNRSGRVLAEICRGWMEYIQPKTEAPTDAVITGNPWVPTLNVSGGRVWFGDDKQEGDSYGPG